MPEITGKNRDKLGKFVKGVSGNPRGKPRGSGLKLTLILKQELEKIPKNGKQPFKILFIKRLLQKAIIEGDEKAMKLIMNYVDGLPKATLDLNVSVDEVPEDEVNNLLKQLTNGRKNSKTSTDKKRIKGKE